MRRSVFTGVFLAAFGLGIAGLGAAAGGRTTGAEPKPETMEIKIDNFTFGPAELTVRAGTTITWTNHDDIPHTVVSTDKAFKSKVPGYRRTVLVHLQHGGNLFLLLFDPPKDDRQSCGAVRGRCA
jgi:plastocyanin